MNRTLKLLGIVGVVAAAGMAAIKRTLPGPVAPYAIHPLPTVSHELRQALHRFEERFGA